MFWKSGLTFRSKADPLPKDRVLWVVQNGRVMGSCVTPHRLRYRIAPALIENRGSNLAVLYGKFPLCTLRAKGRLAVICLDKSLRVRRCRVMPKVGVLWPGTKTKVIIVADDELLRRFQVFPGDQFELRA